MSSPYGINQLLAGLLEADASVGLSAMVDACIGEDMQLTSVRI